MFEPPEPPAKSPCDGTCSLNLKGYCHGCYRTGPEITGWNRFSNFQKQEVLERAAERKTYFSDS